MTGTLRMSAIAAHRPLKAGTGHSLRYHKFREE